MKRWDLTTLPPSTEKQRPRAPGADAPRVPRRKEQIPRVLFSAPECRAVVIELELGQTMGDHHVRERAVVQVVSGRVSVEAGGGGADCEAGTLVTFDPSERHSVRALDDSTLLLMLAPWPAARHYTDGETPHAQQLPRNARIAPDRPFRGS
jgi:quercetin dioxygenase-like cupin family protein